MVPRTRPRATTSSAARLTTAQPAEPASGDSIQLVGFCCLLLFLFLAYSRVGDFWFVGLHLPLLTASLTFLVAVMIGGIRQALVSRIGCYILAFSVWLVVALPFSVWKGGSFSMIQHRWSKSFLAFIIIAGVVANLKQCRQAMQILAWAILTLALLTFQFGSLTLEGRLALEQAALGNPNELAQVMLMGLPFWWLRGTKSAQLGTGQLVTAGGMAVMLVVLAKTGSRGGAVSVAALLLLVLLSSTFERRLKVILGAGVAAVLILSFLPDQLSRRYKLVFGAPADVVEAEGAIASTDTRIRLFWQSVSFTMRSPLVGIGPGQFQVASRDEAVKDGRKPEWVETHNMYTQVSSEAGLPALFFYLAAIFLCLKTSYLIYKRTRDRPELEQISNMAYCLLLAHFGFAVSGLFFNVAYQLYLPTLAGFQVPFTRLALAEIQAKGLSEPEPAPAVTLFQPRRLRPRSVAPSVVSPTPHRTQSWRG